MLHMTEVGIQALQQNVTAIVQSAAAGETVTITLNGRPAVQMDTGNVIAPGNAVGVGAGPARPTQHHRYACAA